ncbi:MAG: M1 family metallopeptidase [Chloroflexi bacterium]|nr:M1 family metallopeptidase [Chloroflexota bacterium]
MQITREVAALLFAISMQALALPSAVAAQAPAILLSRYQISVDVDWAASSLEAKETVTYVNTTGNALGSIVFNVTPANFGTFSLREARVGGAVVETTLEGVVLEVFLPTPLPLGKSAVVELDFQLRVPIRSGRFGAGQGIMTLGNWFPILAVYRGPRLAIGGQSEGWDRHRHGWGDPFFTEVADYRVEVNTSIPLTVAATGRAVAQEERRWVFEAQRVRDFAIGLSPNFETRSTEVEGVQIIAYFLPQHAAGGERFLKDGAEMLAWLNSYVGRYTLPNLSIVEMYSQSAVDVGQEYPGLIFLSSAESASPGGLGGKLSYLLRHEVAHQWFYSMVGNDQMYEPWVDEALVTWLSLHFIRQNYPQLFPSHWEGIIGAQLRQEIGLLGRAPVSGSIYDFASEGLYFSMVYRRGATFLEELYQTMGEEGFSAFLKGFFAAFRDGIATASAFLDMAQAATEANLNPLFRQYLTYSRYQASEPLRFRIFGPPADAAWSGRVVLGIETDASVAGVKVLVDDALALSAPGGKEVSIDSRSLENGSHLLTVIVADTSGRSAEAVQRFLVENKPEPTPTPVPTSTPVPPTILPQVTISVPETIEEAAETLQTYSREPVAYAIAGGAVLILALWGISRRR